MIRLRNDLEAAGISYKDALGRQADLHAMRKTFCTRLHRNNVPLATAMRLMRHTDARLTMVDYCDDQALGVEMTTIPEAAVPVAAAKVDAHSCTHDAKTA